MGTTLEMMTDATIKEILERVNPKSKEGKDILTLVRELQSSRERVTMLENSTDPGLWNDAIETAAKEIDVLARNVGANILLSQAAAQAYTVASESVRKLKK